MSVITDSLQNLRNEIVKHDSDILIGISAITMITTPILAIKATPKACSLIENKEYETGKYKLTPKETIKTVWKCYIPTAASGIVGLTCLMAANNIFGKKNAALATACALSETAFKEYKDKVIETIGDKKETQVRDAIAKNKLEENPTEKVTIISTGKGETLCYESISGRYFYSDIDTIKKAVNDINHRMISESWNYISLNDFYEEINLEPTKIGYDIGWRLDRGLVEVCYSSQLTDKGVPCLVIDYMDMPTYNYDELI